MDRNIISTLQMKKLRLRKMGGRTGILTHLGLRRGAQLIMFVQEKQQGTVLYPQERHIAV